MQQKKVFHFVATRKFGGNKRKTRNVAENRRHRLQKVAADADLLRLNWHCEETLDCPSTLSILPCLSSGRESERVWGMERVLRGRRETCPQEVHIENSQQRAAVPCFCPNFVLRISPMRLLSNEWEKAREQTEWREYVPSVMTSKQWHVSVRGKGTAREVHTVGNWEIMEERVVKMNYG